MMVYCPECELKCREDALVCPRCKHKLAVAEILPLVMEPESPPPPPRDPRRGSAAFIAGMGTFIGWAGVVFGIGVVLAEENLVAGFVAATPAIVGGLVLVALGGIWCAAIDLVDKP